MCFVTIEDDPTQQLPADILPTYDRVVDIAVHREAAWNLEVHGPLLKLALTSFPSLRRDLLTTAHISKPFIPDMHAASAYDCTRAKMVDWA